MKVFYEHVTHIFKLYYYLSVEENLPLKKSCVGYMNSKLLSPCQKYHFHQEELNRTTG